MFDDDVVERSTLLLDVIFNLFLQLISALVRDIEKIHIVFK